MDLYTVYFDRRDDSIDGWFTLHKNGVPVFKRLHARSGQRGYTHTSWVRGKSPIPYSDGGHFLWVGNPVSIGAKAGIKGIGEFYPISNSLKNKSTITNPKNASEERRDIGLHAENSYPGSAGCIVLVDAEHAYNEVFPYLRAIEAPFIRLVVL